MRLCICIKSRSLCLNLTLKAVMLPTTWVWQSFENLKCFKTRTQYWILNQFLNTIPTHSTQTYRPCFEKAESTLEKETERKVRSTKWVSKAPQNSCKLLQRVFPCAVPLCIPAPYLATETELVSHSNSLSVSSWV